MPKLSLSKNSPINYILMVGLLVGATGICWRGNWMKSEDAALMNFNGNTTTDTTVNSIEPVMIMVQGGKFTMGSNNNNNEKPLHNVTISSFKLAKYETTQALWQEVMGSDPSGHKDCMDCPVTGVSWDDIQTFIQRLNAHSGKHYRLPTEAEWEYAARGGTKSRGFEYAGSNDVNAVAWTWVNSRSTTQPVGQKEPNELGLYDMSGNVFEWCNDWYDENYYSKRSDNNPKGPATGPHRVFRGGNVASEPAKSRVAYRNPFRLGYATLGFRLASSL
jgi:sulfatase modifying factor 1